MVRVDDEINTPDHTVSTITNACLRALSADTTGKLDIFRHDGNTLSVNSAQIGILEETNKVGLSSLLKCKNGRSLETKIALEILGDLPDQTLEGKLADQEIRRLLVPTNLTKSDGAGTVTVGLFDTSGGGGRFASSLGGELLTGGFTPGRFTGCLFGTGHG